MKRSEAYLSNEVKIALDDLETHSGLLTQWEESFLADMFERWHDGYSFSQNQLDKLEEIRNELPTRQT